MALRVLVIANKWWECDPLLNVLLNDNARPASALGWPRPLHFPLPRPDQNHLPKENPDPKPRAVFHLSNISVEVWCISDLLEHLPDVPSDNGKYQSSSEQKMKYLPRIFDGKRPDFVVAFGTAAYPSTTSENGSVVVGSRVFLHNGHPSSDPNPNSQWQKGPFDEIIESDITDDVFNRLTVIETSPTPSVIGRFIVPPLNPVLNAKLLARHDYVALSEINVTDYTEYTVKDTETVSAFSKTNNISLASSLETTHGLIRVSSDAPFVFVSGITDPVGFFGTEVNPRSYAQNTVAAHNAGIVVAWMLPQLDSLMGES